MRDPAGRSRFASGGRCVRRYLSKFDGVTSPFLGLGARLSQAWLNKWTIVLVLVAIRLALAMRGLHQQLDRASAELEQSCPALEATASALVSAPHGLAHGTNRLIAHGVEGAVSAVSSLTVDALTAVEEILLFAINAFKATYVCLLELAITGSIDVALDATEAVGNALNETLHELGQDLQQGVTDANTAIRKVSSVITKAAAFLGQKVDIPQISIPQLQRLDKFEIPSSFDTNLDKVRASLDLDALQVAADNALRFPFEQLKYTVNASLSNYTFDRRLLPVPPAEHFSFCSDGSFSRALDGVEDVVLDAYRIVMALLLVAAALAVIPHALLIWYKWLAVKHERTALSKSLQLARPTSSKELIFLIEQPLFGFLGLTAAKRFKQTSHRNIVRWVISYLTTPAATFVLLLGVAGLLGCLLQWVLLRSLRSATPGVAADIGNVTALVVARLESISSQWANQTNTRLNVTQAELNKQLFGWVKTSTTTVNNTLGVFTDTVTGTLNTTFGGTLLYEPILKVLDCIILLKVRGIEKGLTWVHDRAHISLPRVPENMMTIAPEDAQSALLDVGTTSAEAVSKALDKVGDVWAASIREETYFAGGLLLCWLLLALFALLRAVTLWRWRAMRGRICKEEIGPPQPPPPELDPSSLWLHADTRRAPRDELDHEDLEEKAFFRVETVTRHERDDGMRTEPATQHLHSHRAKLDT